MVHRSNLWNPLAVEKYPVSTLLCLCVYASVSKLYVMFRPIGHYKKLPDYIKTNMPESKHSGEVFFLHVYNSFSCAAHTE